MEGIGTEKTAGNSPSPWKNGHYLGRPGFLRQMCFIENNEFLMHPANGRPSIETKGIISYGNFGEAHPDVVSVTGKEIYNVEMRLLNGFWKVNGILSEDSKKVTFYGSASSVDCYEWMSEEEVTRYIELGDPVDAPPNHYKIEPENQGPLLWITGAPGLGKSTTADMLSKKANYVYYEADAFLWHLNPYIPPDIDESSRENLLDQNILKGVSQERLDIVSKGLSQIVLMCQGMKYDIDKTRELYTIMCQDIVKEQKRIGGNWAVAQAVPTRVLRDQIRSKMGKNLIFIVLHMKKEDQIARLKVRHGDDETLIEPLSNIYDIFEPAGVGEPNTIHIEVTKEMSRETVVEKIIDSVLIQDFK